MKRKTKAGRRASSSGTISEWSPKAVKRLNQVLKIASSEVRLARLVPGGPWQVGVKLVGSASMTRLNSSFRGKAYATDILSFPAIEPFRVMGVLGELVVCLPTLKAQAREMGHSVQAELDVLLVHGVLHLLGFDHEKGGREAVKMAKWESHLLSQLNSMRDGRLLGLIHRVNSGMNQT